MDALVKRDPSGLPAVLSAVFTGNGQRLELGDGEAGVPTILVVRSARSVEADLQVRLQGGLKTALYIGGSEAT